MQTMTKKEDEIFTPAADLAVYQKRIENYKGVIKKSNLIRDKFIQDNDELSAGVLMLAEIAGISVPTNLKARDIISELAVILENSCQDERLDDLPKETKQTLSALLSRETILNMTKNCIEISENVDESQEGSGDIVEANGRLWDYLTELATAQGIDLPEYEP